MTHSDMADTRTWDMYGYSTFGYGTHTNIVHIIYGRKIADQAFLLETRSNPSIPPPPLQKKKKRGGGEAI